MAQYTLELDIPTTESTETGYAKVRYMSETDPETATSDGLFYESHTGTVMLKPLQLRSDWTSSTAAEACKLRLYDLTVASDCWEEMPSCALNAEDRDYMMRSKLSFDPLDLTMGRLQIPGAAITDIYGSVLTPIMETADSFPINQGLMLRAEIADPSSSSSYLGLRFGNFFLTASAEGELNLYWLSGGVWKWRKKFAEAKPKGVGASLLAGAAWQGRSVVSIMILPFGRKNILIRCSSNSLTFSGIYTNPEADWDSELGGYNITSAGKACLYIDTDMQKSIGVQLSKVKYETSGYLNETWDLPYAPTLAPDKMISSTHTAYGCSAAVTLLDPDTGAAWTPTGLCAAVSTHTALTGDGHSSPWVDGYQFWFAPKVETYTPGVVTVPDTDIVSLKIDQGESFDDQRLTAVIKDKGDYLKFRIRGTINGRLLIDGIPYMIVQFKGTETQVGRQTSYITLQGKNYGAAKLSRKRFFHPPDYAGWQHPVAVASCLQLCGFLPIGIDTIPDTATLPSPDTAGSGNDTKTEAKSPSQPELNQPVRDFVEWIIDSYSDRWKLWYDAFGYWHYKPLSTSLVPIATFYKQTRVGQLWYDKPIVSVDPAEGNGVWLFGKTEKDEPICAPARRLDQQTMYGIDQILVVDTSISSMAALGEVLPRLADATLWDKVFVSWKGPFTPNVGVFSIVYLEGLGTIRICNISSEANSPQRLEKDASTSYKGELLLQN